MTNARSYSRPASIAAMVTAVSHSHVKLCNR